MMYPYTTFNDDTEVTYSQVQKDGTVKVYVETPVDGGFKDLTSILPDYIWLNHGYSATELSHWKKYIQNNTHIIMELAEKEKFTDIEKDS